MATAASSSTKVAVANERDVYGLSGDIKKDLLNYLDTIASSGDFATMKSYSKLSVNPHVRLLGADSQEEVEIGIPLGLQDAQKLIKVARQAPFGKGEQTIVDTSFRNTWELNPSQFSLSDKWQPYVDTLMRSACDGLGVKTNDVRAELYKMLLYEKGAMFKPHADSEKTKGMFGTLVISLPSAHFGGSVILSHNGKQHEFQTSYHEYLAWYSNVTHEVLEVTSGCRWVLTYNLVQEQPGKSGSEVASRKLHAILADWKQQKVEAATASSAPSDQPAQDSESSSVSSTSTKHEDTQKSGPDLKQAIYLLEHKYTQSNLNIESLKDADRLRAKELLSICDDYGYTLYLANLEREVTGQVYENDYSHDFSENDDDGDEDDEDDEDNSQYSGDSYHHIWDICGDLLKLTCVVDDEGHEVFKDIPIQERDIVQVHPFKRKPNKSEYEGYTGNEGASATHWYKDTVIVLIPNDSFADVMMHRPKYSSEVVPAQRVSMMLEYLVKRTQKTPEHKSRELKDSVRRACEIIAARNNHPGQLPYGRTKPTYTDEIILDAFKVCITLGIREPLRDLATAFKKGIPDFALQSLRDLISQVGFEEIKPIFHKVVSKKEGISARFKALSLLAGANPLTIDAQTEISPEIKMWAKDSLELVLSDFGLLTDGDACELARVAVVDTSGTVLKDQYGILKLVEVAGELTWKRIAPKIHEILDIPTPTKTAFVMSFLCKLVEQSESSASDNTIITEMYESILRAAIPGFALRGPEERPSYYGYDRDPEVREPVLDGHHLAAVFQHCMKLGLDDMVNQLIGRILQEIDIMDTKDFPTAVLPLLRRLLSDIKKGEVQAERFRYLFQSSLIQYIVRHVGEEPRQANWSQKPIKCKDRGRRGYCALPMNSKKLQEPCEDCQQLNTFLKDPKEKVWRFTAAEDRRKHLINEVYDRECFTTVERNKKPYTLVLTKHKKSMDEKHRKWEARVAEVKSHLLDLECRHRFLDNVLAEKYGDIMVVHVKKLMQELGQATGGSEDRTSASAEDVQGHQNSRGKKRKAVVFDLADD
ncbi:hypothetical protein KCU78_g5824, partial [Aureobasidium melanogenum]